MKGFFPCCTENVYGCSEVQNLAGIQQTNQRGQPVSVLIRWVKNKMDGGVSEGGHLLCNVIGSPMMMIRTPATIWRAREKEMSVRTAI